MLTVNALIILTSYITTLLGAFAIAPFIASSQIANTLAYAAMYTLVLPILFTINALGLFTLIHIVTKDTCIVTATTKAFQTFKKNWLVCFETALFQFLINLIYFIIAWTIFFLYMGFAWLIISIGISSAIWPIAIATKIIALFGAALLIIKLIGFITTFNYTVWINLSKRLNRYGFIPLIEGAFRWITGKR
jgi:hypothetical protein